MAAPPQPALAPGAGIDLSRQPVPALAESAAAQPVAVTAAAAAAAAPAAGAAGSSVAAATPVADKPFVFTARIHCGSAPHALMVRNALAVDAELRKEQVERTLTVDGPLLLARFAATDMRTQRAAVGSFCDLAALALRALEKFGHTAVPEQATKP